MSRQIKMIALVCIVIVGYYGLQYGSSAVHYNCTIIKDDCPPPIYGVSELIYRVMATPPWLNQFKIEPTMYLFTDGRFGFWEADVEGKTVVIRVSVDGSPTLQWIFEEELPQGVDIRPATGEHIQQWLADHPEYELGE